MMLSSLLVAAMALPAPALDGCSSSQGCSSTRAVAASVKEKSILETAVAAGQFNTLAAALKAGDLLEPLSGEGPFTVFAPTDAAFAALPEGTLDSLLKPEAKGTLQAILTYHVVPGRLDAEHVVKSANAATLNGQRVGFKVDDHGAFINGAKIVKTDIHCSNGIIHVIDAVILPSTKDVVATAVEAGSFKTLAAALKAAQLVEALQGDGPFTVFAPNDAAFAAAEAREPRQAPGHPEVPRRPRPCVRRRRREGRDRPHPERPERHHPLHRGRLRLRRSGPRAGRRYRDLERRHPRRRSGPAPRVVRSPSAGPGTASDPPTTPPRHACNRRPQCWFSPTRRRSGPRRLLGCPARGGPGPARVFPAALR
jgi:uncharacterized surface protein with fasciclin (FAS1) repeats